jgi:DNA-binding HxlR family transcriptional regulator
MSRTKSESRLKELEKEGFIQVIEKEKPPMLVVRWALTEKGRDPGGREGG